MIALQKGFYFIYAIILIGYTIATRYLLRALQINAAHTFRPAWLILTDYLVYLILGAILGAEYLLSQFKKEGPWQVNCGKLLVVGIPVLLFSFYIPLYFLFRRWLPLPEVCLNQDFVHVNTLILGYVAATSLYKKNGPP